MVGLRRRLDFRKILVAIYFVFAAVYLAVGLKPVDAKTYEIATTLTIPSISLVSDVTELELEEYRLNTPDTIVGSFSNAENKTILIGHSSTVFENLKASEVDDLVFYNSKTYKIVTSEVKPRDEIKMSELLKSEEKDTLVLMTCAGESLGNGDATHRLVITAVEV